MSEENPAMANEKSVMALIRAARPAFRNKWDKVAFAVHSAFLASGHVLTATGTSADAAFSSSSTDEVGVDHWNELEDSYAFVYINPDNGLKKVLVKCLVMNDKLIVDALVEGASEPLHLETDVDEYVAGDGDSNYSAQFKNLDKLVKSLDKEMLSKLFPSPKPSMEISEGSRRNRNFPSFEGPELRSPLPHPHSSGVVLPPVNPGGYSDILPGPAAGMYPRSDFGSGGSMLIGPNDPRWFGGSGGDLAFPGGQPGVPPGARFDPYGPPGVPGFEPNRFGRNPQRPGRPHPDLQHFPGGDFI